MYLEGTSLASCFALMVGVAVRCLIQVLQRPCCKSHPARNMLLLNMLGLSFGNNQTIRLHGRIDAIPNQAT